MYQKNRRIVFGDISDGRGFYSYLVLLCSRNSPLFEPNAQKMLTTVIREKVTGGLGRNHALYLRIFHIDGIIVWPIFVAVKDAQHTYKVSTGRTANRADLLWFDSILIRMKSNKPNCALNVRNLVGELKSRCSAVVE